MDSYEFDFRLFRDMRKRTALPYLLCRKLLIEAKGDIDLAIQIYRDRERQRRLSRPGATDIDWGF